MVAGGGRGTWIKTSLPMMPIRPRVPGVGLVLLRTPESKALVDGTCMRTAALRIAILSPLSVQVAHCRWATRNLCSHLALPRPYRFPSSYTTTSLQADGTWHLLSQCKLCSNAK
eukprot:3796492-Amphidinium_carterae.1